jgi:hypothetical protein
MEVNGGIDNQRFNITTDEPICVSLDVVPYRFCALGNIEPHGSVVGPK